MAGEGKILYSDLFDAKWKQQAIDDFVALEKSATVELRKMADVAREIKASLPDYIKTGADLSKLNEVIKKSNTLQSEVARLQKEQKSAADALDKQRQAAYQKQAKDEEAALRKKSEMIKKEDELNAKKTQKALDNIAKEEAKQKQLAAVHKDSITALRLHNAELVKERNSLDPLSARYKTLTKEIATNTDKLKLHDKEIGRSFLNVGNYGSALKGLGKQLLMAAGLTGGVIMLTNTLKKAFAIMTEFEAEQSNLAAVLGTTKDKTDALTKSAVQLGSSTIFTAKGVTGLQTELAKLGFTQDEILATTKAVLDFAAAANADLPSAAAVMGIALKVFGLDMSKAYDAAATMAVGMAKSALAFEDFETSLSTVGPVARAFGFTLEDTVALIGTLRNAGFDASKASTALRNILLNLADANGDLAKAMGGPVKTLPDLIAGLKTLRDRGIDLNETLQLTDKRSVAAFNAFLDTGDAALILRDSLIGVNDELQTMVDVQLDNVAGDVKLFTGAWQGFILSVDKGDGILSKVVRGSLGAFTNMFKIWGGVYKEQEQANDRLEKYNAFMGLVIGKYKHLADTRAGMLALVEQTRGELNLSVEDMANLEEDIKAFFVRVDEAKAAKIKNDLDAEIKAAAEKKRIAEGVADAAEDAEEDKQKAINKTKGFLKDFEAEMIRQDELFGTSETIEEYEKRIADALKLAEDNLKGFNDEMERTDQLFGTSETLEDIQMIEENIRGMEEALKPESWRDKFSEISGYFSDFASQAINVWESLAKRQEELAQSQVDIEQQKVDDIEKELTRQTTLEAAGSANNVDLLRKQLAEQKSIRDIATKELQKSQKQQQRIDDAKQISSIITAVASIIANWSAVGPFGSILGLIAAAAMLVGWLAMRSKAKATVPAMAEGTEYVDSKEAPQGKDTIDAKLDRGERVVDKEENKKLKGIKNKDLAKYSRLGQAVMEGNIDLYALNFAVRKPGDNSIDFTELSKWQKEGVNQQKETNSLLKKWKFVSGDGHKVVDMNGNIVNYT